MFKSNINFKSNSSKTGLICIEINSQPKKIQIMQTTLKFIYMKFIQIITVLMISSLLYIHKLPLWLVVVFSE